MGARQPWAGDVVTEERALPAVCAMTGENGEPDEEQRIGELVLIGLGSLPGER